jgi:hypothetical protein
MVVKMLCLNLMLLLHFIILHLISTVVFCTCLSSNISWGLGVFYPANIRTSKIQHLCQLAGLDIQMLYYLFAETINVLFLKIFIRICLIISYSSVRSISMAGRSNSFITKKANIIGPSKNFIHSKRTPVQSSIQWPEP